MLNFWFGKCRAQIQKQEKSCSATHKIKNGILLHQEGNLPGGSPWWATGLLRKDSQTQTIFFIDINQRDQIIQQL